MSDRAVSDRAVSDRAGAPGAQRFVMRGPRHPRGRVQFPRAAWIVASVCLALSGLIVVNSFGYFASRSPHAFLVEKGPIARDPLWKACFYLHVAGGIVCIVLAPLLLWNGLRRGSMRLHRRLGRGYAVAALGWAGPTGLYLALFAKGGLPGQLGFLTLGVLWYGATVLGVRAVGARRIDEHVRWMLRSYALILSAVFFRMLHVGFYLASVADEPNYVLSTWLSTGLSLWVGEWMVLRFSSSEQVGSRQDGAAIGGMP